MGNLRFTVKNRYPKVYLKNMVKIVTPKLQNSKNDEMGNKSQNWRPKNLSDVSKASF